MKTRAFIICAIALLFCLSAKGQDPFKNLKKTNPVANVTFNGNSPTIVDFLTSFTNMANDELRYVVASQWDRYIQNLPLSDGASFTVDQKNGYIRFDLDFDVAYPDDQNGESIYVEYCIWNCDDGSHKLFAENVGSFEQKKPAFAQFDGLYVYAYDNASKKLYMINQDLLGLDENVQGDVTFALPRKGKDIDVTFYKGSKTTQGTLAWNGNGFNLSQQNTNSSTKAKDNSSSSSNKTSSSSSSNKTSSSSKKLNFTGNETGSDSGHYDDINISFSNCWIEVVQSENMVKYHFDMNVKGAKGQSVYLLSRVCESGGANHHDKKGNFVECEATYQIHYNNANFKDNWLGLSLDNNSFNPLPGKQTYCMQIYTYHGTQMYILNGQSTNLCFSVTGSTAPISSPKSWSKIAQGLHNL